MVVLMQRVLTKKYEATLQKSWTMPNLCHNTRLCALGIRYCTCEVDIWNFTFFKDAHRQRLTFQTCNYASCRPARQASWLADSTIVGRQVCNGEKKSKCQMLLSSIVFSIIKALALKVNCTQLWGSMCFGVSPSICLLSGSPLSVLSVRHTAGRGRALKIIPRTLVGLCLPVFAPAFQTLVFFCFFFDHRCLTLTCLHSCPAPVSSVKDWIWHSPPADFNTDLLFTV